MALCNIETFKPRNESLRAERELGLINPTDRDEFNLENLADEFQLTRKAMRTRLMGMVATFDTLHQRSTNMLYFSSSPLMHDRYEEGGNIIRSFSIPKIRRHSSAANRTHQILTNICVIQTEPYSDDGEFFGEYHHDILERNGSIEPIVGSRDVKPWAPRTLQDFECFTDKARDTARPKYDLSSLS